MTKRVFKYVIEVSGFQEVEMPSGADILTAQIQYDKICLWALVNDDNPKEKRRIIVAGTGHPIEYEGILAFIGTIQELNGQLIWHVFEEIK